MPATFCNSGPRRRITSLALASRSARGFRLIIMRPLLRVALVPSTPMKDDRLATAGSFSTTSATACWRSAMAGKRDGLAGLGHALDGARVLHREEALGHQDVEQHSEGQGARRHQQGQALALQHPLQHHPVAGDDAVEEVAGHPVEAPLLVPRAHALSRRAHIIGVSVSDTKPRSGWRWPA
jgi:hypothetical protein